MIDDETAKVILGLTRMLVTSGSRLQEAVRTKEGINCYTCLLPSAFCLLMLEQA